MSDLFKSVLEWSNIAFAAVFTIEAGLKIAGYGRTYFNEHWNRYYAHRNGNVASGFLYNVTISRTV